VPIEMSYRLYSKKWLLYWSFL